MDIAQNLAAGLADMQIGLSTAAQAKLGAYLALLAQWNRAYNLTSVRDPEHMVSRHLLDSLAVLPFCHGHSLADLGSGAGLPGVPLAIARPHLAVTLIESNGKKARFLAEVRRSLALANVTVAPLRVQDASGAFDTVTARGLASLRHMLDWGGHLLAADGHWLALKGRLDAIEIGSVPAPFRILQVHRLAVPGVTAERCVVILARTTAT